MIKKSDTLGDAVQATNKQSSPWAALKIAQFKLKRMRK